MSRGSANSENLRFGIGPAAHDWGFFKRRFWGDYVRRLHRTLDASDNRGQAVVGLASSSATKHFIGQKPVAHIGFHCAQKAALRPVAVVGQGAIDDPKHIFLGHIGSKSSHMWHPVLSRLVQPLYVAVLPRESHLA